MNLTRMIGGSMRRGKHNEGRKRKQAKFAGIPFRLVHSSHLKARSWKHPGKELLERTKEWDRDRYIELNRKGVV